MKHIVPQIPEIPRPRPVVHLHYLEHFGVSENIAFVKSRHPFIDVLIVKIRFHSLYLKIFSVSVLPTLNSFQIFTKACCDLKNLKFIVIYKVLFFWYIICILTRKLCIIWYCDRIGIIYLSITFFKALKIREKQNEL